MTATGPRVSRLRGAALALVVVTGLASCATPPPQPVPEPEPAVAPAVMSAQQNETVLSDLRRVLDAGDTALDPALLAPRVDGPALAMRTAEYVRSTATAGERTPTALPTGAQAEIVPQSTQWPRVQLVVTEQPDDLQVPRILVLDQASPRDQYRLWGWARLFPGVSMPTTADADNGSPVLAPDAEDLAVPPDEVAAAYTELLATGTGSAETGTFAPDPFYDGIAAARTALAASVQEIGTVAETYTPSTDGPLTVLGTVDGGAIVVDSMTTTSTISITLAGGTLTLSPFEAALAGVSQAGAALARTYTGVLVFYVPPASSDAQVQLLAADQVLTAATAQ
jgi:hypothetical protein